MLIFSSCFQINIFINQKRTSHRIREKDELQFFLFQIVYILLVTKQKTIYSRTKTEFSIIWETHYCFPFTNVFYCLIYLRIWQHDICIPHTNNRRICFMQ